MFLGWYVKKVEKSCYNFKKRKKMIWIKTFSKWKNILIYWKEALKFLDSELSIWNFTCFMLTYIQDNKDKIEKIIYSEINILERMYKTNNAINYIYKDNNNNNTKSITNWNKKTKTTVTLIIYQYESL